MPSPRRLVFAAFWLAVAADFFNPPQATVWTIGDTQTISYNHNFPNYTIALWQQTLGGGSATIGPIVFREFFCLAG